MPHDLVTSRYNFSVPTGNGAILFSAQTGATLRLTGSDGEELARWLSGPPASVGDDDLPEALLASLRERGFVVPAGADEVDVVRRRFWHARAEAPMVVTILTTLDCNLGCYYCYQERTADRLTLADVPKVVALLRERLVRSGKRTLNLQWYGGEPLLNLEFMEAASLAIQEMCRSIGARYAASITSNGTLWPEDVAGFVKRHALRQAQITFDGLRENHDRRRRYRGEHLPSEGASSFERTVAMFDRLVDCCDVDLRLNVDERNKVDVLPLIEMARQRGWFSGRHRVNVQVARITRYSEHTEFLRAAEISPEEEEALRKLVQEHMEGPGKLMDPHLAHHGLGPRGTVCGALGDESIVIGADLRLYRCGVQVHEPHRAVRSLDDPGLGGLQPLQEEAEKPRRRLPLLTKGNDDRFWNSFDPTAQPLCGKCSFLPICWGSCPKMHLEGDDHGLREECHHWRAHLPEMIAKSAGTALVSEVSYGDADQFRG